MTRAPQILVFTTSTISDPGVASAGLMRLKYPPQTAIIRVPCSSMIRPEWIVLAIECGFDGVFVAADGTDCPYLRDCTERTARGVEAAQKILASRGVEPERVRMAAVCSVCGEAFVRIINDFFNALSRLGPVRL
jgi:coenzyme F420-reducing hydrogenase delta subunit